MTLYDPYKVKQPKTSTDNNRTQTVIATARKMATKESHYDREYILFDKHLEPDVFEYVQPPQHRVYISEAAKAYAEVASIKLANIVLEEQFEERPEILTPNYFSEEEAVLHYCRPHSKEIVFYNLVDIYDKLSITKEL